MRLTTKSEYTILGLLYIARQKNKDFVKIDEICDKHGISKKYLEQLFLVLKQNRYLKTRRGAAGGYTLAKPPSQISIAEIIRLMDGALAPTEAVSKYFYANTPLSGEKKIMKVFKDIRNYISNKLESLKLSDLV
jgi:Rrf2 family transcriptional regulator, cysteine metabolism repressor